jgi:hypothetical protein
MLKSTQDHWKEKAEQEYLYKKSEVANFQQLQENQNAWKKRFNEASWLLQGADAQLRGDTNEEAKHVEEKQLLDFLDKKIVKHHKYELKDVHLEEVDEFLGQTPSSPNNKDKRGKKGSKDSPRKGSPHKKGSSGGIWSRTVTSVVQSPLRFSSSPYKNKSREDFQKEDEARRMLQSDERKQRDAFLAQSVDRIKMLEGVDDLLSRPKLPKHHRHAKVSRFRCFF